MSTSDLHFSSFILHLHRSKYARRRRAPAVRAGMVRTAGGIANKPDCPNRSQCRAAVAGRRRSRRRAAIAARAGPGATGASESLSVSHGHRDSHPPAAGPFWVGPLRSVAAAAEAAAAAAPPPDAGDPPMRRRRPCPQLPGPQAWARFTGIVTAWASGPARAVEIVIAECGHQPERQSPRCIL